MQPKHAWNKVGAKSKEQIAELIARAVSEGSKSGNIITWRYRGQTIKVTMSPSGQIGNAYVVTR
ncbi:MAG: hypothetical protein J6M18_06885 [Actinomycetaceae bacterium]|nr:hypothetical protein [Actinomycetaceae bacterium]